MATGSPHLAIQALNEVAKLLGKLTEEQLEALVKGEALVEFRLMDDIVTSRPVKKAAGAKAPKISLDLDQLVSEIRALTAEDAVEQLLLERDKQLTLPMMRALAEKIGPPVSTRGDKATIRKNIAAGTAGLLNRPASVFSGTWNR
jgi:hypothetical protein